MASTSTPTLRKYVVVCDALVVTTGKKTNGKPEYAKVLRGRQIQGNPESERIELLLRKGAIVQVKSAQEEAELRADLSDARKSRRRQTVRQAAQKMGAPDDPVEAPLEAHLPVAAPHNPTPEAIFADADDE